MCCYWMLNTCYHVYWEINNSLKLLLGSLLQVAWWTISEEKNLIISLPAVFREDICLTCFKVFSEVFIKVLQVIFTEQALRIDTLMVRHLFDLQKERFMIHTLPHTFGRYPRSFVACLLRSRCLSSSTICLRSASLSCSMALSLASSSLKREIRVTVEAGHSKLTSNVLCLLMFPRL